MAGGEPQTGPAQLAASQPFSPCPVMQENVWNPLKPQLCSLLSPVFHLTGLAGCHFCASELCEVGEVQVRPAPRLASGSSA